MRHGDVGDPVLRATNGKMLAVILDNPSFTTLLPSKVRDVQQHVAALSLGRMR